MNCSKRSSRRNISCVPDLIFTVYGTPAPAGSKRGFYNKKAGRVIITDDSVRSRPWKALVSDAAIEAMKGREMFVGPIFLGLEFYVKRPKGHFGTGRNEYKLKQSSPKHPTTRPDLLKLSRGIEDALSTIVYRDDSQIAREILDKFYGEPERVEVRVRVLD